jgi:quercetin dioxygenase-like cupin family protein
MSDPICTRRAADAEAVAIRAPWGELRWLAEQKLGNANGITLGRVTILPGQSNPRHSHPNCEEVLYLLSGQLEHTVGKNRTLLGPGDTITVAPGVFHNATNVGAEPADMIVAFSSAVREFLPESKVE